MADPFAVPSLELSRAAWLAMVAISPVGGVTVDVRVVATGPPVVFAQALFAVLC